LRSTLSILDTGGAPNLCEAQIERGYWAQSKNDDNNRSF